MLNDQEKCMNNTFLGLIKTNWVEKVWKNSQEQERKCICNIGLMAKKKKGAIKSIIKSRSKF